MATSTLNERALAPGLIQRLTSHICASGDTITIPAPATGEPLATLPMSTAGDVHTAYDRAGAAQAAWAALPVKERVKPFMRLSRAVTKRRAEILDIVQLETGKARKHAFEEVMDVALCSLYYGR